MDWGISFPPVLNGFMNIVGDVFPGQQPRNVPRDRHGA